MTDEHKHEAPFSLVDWIGIVVAVMATLGLLAFPVAVAPVWRSMLAELGESLPGVTVLALQPWFTPVLAVLPVVLLVLAWRGRAPSRIGIRRAMVVAAFASSTAAVAFTLSAIYTLDIQGQREPARLIRDLEHEKQAAVNRARMMPWRRSSRRRGFDGGSATADPLRRRRWQAYATIMLRFRSRMADRSLDVGRRGNEVRVTAEGSPSPQARAAL